MNKLSKKSLVYCIIIMISFLILRLILKNDNEFIEVLALVSSALTLFCVIKNYKVSSLLCSCFYLPSYFLVMNYTNNFQVWFIVYIVVIAIVVVIERITKRVR